MSDVFLMTFDRQERERAERSNLASKARIAKFRTMDKCPVCGSGELKVRNIVESTWNVDITVEFHCGAIIKAGTTRSLMEASCHYSTVLAIENLEREFRNSVSRNKREAKSK